MKKDRWEMDFSNRDNRQSAQPMQQQAAATPAASDRSASTKRSSGGGILGKLGPLVVLFGVAILSAAVVLALVFGGDNNDKNLESTLINKDQYQAVFLDSQDGQVYFGKMAVYNESLYILSDIFYVRVENPIQPQGTEAQQPNISLAKLGNELHGPEDVMFVSRDKVLYWENLKDDGQVVTAITNFKANGEQAPAQQETEDSSSDDAASGTQPAGTEEQDDTADTSDTTPPADTTTP